MYFQRGIFSNIALCLGHITVVRNEELVITEEIERKLRRLHMTLIKVKLVGIGIYTSGKDYIGSVPKWSSFLELCSEIDLLSRNVSFCTKESAGRSQWSNLSEKVI